MRIDCAALSIDAEIVALPQTLGLAVGGTVFLDEVGGIASRSCRHGCSRRCRPHGDAAARHVNVRIIASTNRDLHSGRARRRVSRGPVLRSAQHASPRIPPLRTRVEDIPPLVQDLSCRNAVAPPGPARSTASIRIPWRSCATTPGRATCANSPTLVERAMVTQDGAGAEDRRGPHRHRSPAERAALIAAAAVDPGSTTRTALAGAIDFDDTLSTGLHDVQREHILRVLNATHWVIEGNSGAALRARPQTGHAAPSHEEARHLARPEPTDELITAFSRQWRQSRIGPPAPLRLRVSPG